MGKTRVRETLGDELMRVETKGWRLRVHEKGLRAEVGEERFAGPFGALARILTQNSELRVHGVKTLDGGFLRLETRKGRTLALSTTHVLGDMRDDVRAAFALVDELSTPAMGRRICRDMRDGGTADLGWVRLTEETLEVRNALGRWRALPLAELAGFAVREGHLFIDHDPRRPRLWSETVLGNVANKHALLDVLAELRPDADLRELANVERAERLVSKLPWGPPNALTRQPGTATGRTRCMILGAPLLAGALYLLAAVPFAAMTSAHDVRQFERLGAVAAVGSTAAAAAAAAPGGEGPAEPLPLEKLQDAGPLACYLVASGDEDRARLLARGRGGRLETWSTPPNLAERPYGLFQHYKQHVLTTPDRWLGAPESYEPWGRPHVESARLLAVVELGAEHAVVRVVRLPDGEPVAAGRVALPALDREPRFGMPSEPEEALYRFLAGEE